MEFKLGQKVLIVDEIGYDMLKGLIGTITKIPTLNQNYYYVSYNSGRYNEEQIWYFMEEDLQLAPNPIYQYNI